MTRKEAIEFGNMWLKVNEDCKESNTYEFFQIAVKELEKETVPKGIYEHNYFLLKELKIEIENLKRELEEKK